MNANIKMDLGSRNLSSARLFFNKILYPIAPIKMSSNLSGLTKHNDITLKISDNLLNAHDNEGKVIATYKSYAKLLPKTGVSEMQLPKGTPARQIRKILKSVISDNNEVFDNRMQTANIGIDYKHNFIMPITWKQFFLTNNQDTSYNKWYGEWSDFEDTSIFDGITATAGVIYGAILGYQYPNISESFMLSLGKILLGMYSGLISGMIASYVLENLFKATTKLLMTIINTSLDGIIFYSNERKQYNQNKYWDINDSNLTAYIAKNFPNLIISDTTIHKIFNRLSNDTILELRRFAPQIIYSLDVSKSVDAIKLLSSYEASRILKDYRHLLVSFIKVADPVKIAEILSYLIEEKEARKCIGSHDREIWVGTGIYHDTDPWLYPNGEEVMELKGHETVYDYETTGYRYYDPGWLIPILQSIDKPKLDAILYGLSKLNGKIYSAIKEQLPEEKRTDNPA